MDWTQIILGVVGLIVSGTGTLVAWQVQQAREESRRAERERARLDAARQEADTARHAVTIEKLDGLTRLVKTIEQRVDANQVESREEFRLLHEQDRRQMTAIARLEGRIGLRGEDAARAGEKG